MTVPIASDAGEVIVHVFHALHILHPAFCIWISVGGCSSP